HAAHYVLPRRADLRAPNGSRRTGSSGTNPAGSLRVAARSLLIAALIALGCAVVPGPSGPPAPHVSDAIEGGDDQFRASQRLVMEGLDADENGDSARAESRYDRALQIDASNPWVYLALARHYVDAGDPGRALSHLDRAEALLDTREPASPGAKIHC